MSEKSVLTKLNEQHRHNLRKTERIGSADDLWQIQSKSKNLKTFDSIGSLGFRNGKLIYISRDWSPDGDDQPMNFGAADAIYGLLAQFQRDGNTACQISAQENNSPKYEVRTILITCGSKDIRIDVIEADDNFYSVLISEILDEMNIKKVTGARPGQSIRR